VGRYIDDRGKKTRDAERTNHSIQIWGFSISVMFAASQPVGLGALLHYLFTSPRSTSFFWLLPILEVLGNKEPLPNLVYSTLSPAHEVTSSHKHYKVFVLSFTQARPEINDP